jgi:phenylacetate-CoA ligase
MKKEDPKFIIASPSYLRVIAKAVSDQGITTVKPRVLVTWGEVLDEGTREYLTSNLGSRVYNGYGCTEAAPLGMAWECKERAGLHINCDVVLLEILKDGEPVSPGEKGETFVTSLFRFSTPMIRYRLDDIVTLSDENCQCGREMPMIKNIEGRMIDFVKMPNGRLISPYALMSVVQDIPGIAKYQIVQETKDRMVVKIERGRGFTENTVIQVRNSCSELLDSDIQFDIDVVDRIPIARGRKFRAVESRI